MPGAVLKLLIRNGRHVSARPHPQQNAEGSAGGMTAKSAIRHAKHFAFNIVWNGHLLAFSIGGRRTIT